MIEGELDRMQKLPFRAACKLIDPAPCRTTQPPFPPHSVDRITDHRMPDVREVHPDLVGAASLERDIEKVCALPTLPDPRASGGVTPVGHDRHSLAVVGISTEWCLDRDR